VQPRAYQAWYRTPRGRWVADCEFGLMLRLLQPRPGQSLLDAGSGTGEFSRRFQAVGLEVTGIDPDPDMLACARAEGGGVEYLRASVLQLPFRQPAFDYCAAVTSLCFVATPQRAVEEMWRVSRRGIVLGLLNRHSLLYWHKRGRGGYRGARWDTIAQARSWLARLDAGVSVRLGSAVWFAQGGPLARCLEARMPRRPAWGGFLARAVTRAPGNDPTMDTN